MLETAVFSVLASVLASHARKASSSPARSGASRTEGVAYVITQLLCGMMTALWLKSAVKDLNPNKPNILSFNITIL